MELISREEALKIFNDVHPLDHNANAYKRLIEQLPTVELKGSFKPDGEYEYIIPHEKMKELAEMARTLFRPKGKWIVSKNDSNYNCSICGCNPRKSFRASSLEWIREINGCDMQYCPWCGAEMEKEERCGNHQ